MCAKVLVTGGAGFIGSHLVDRLVECGFDVVVLDSFFSGKRENVASHLGNPRFSLFEGDVRRRADLRSALEDVDYVFHLAAAVNVPLSVENPLYTNEVNVDGTLNVLVESLRAGVKRLIYASSCAVYGEPLSLPVDENHPTRPSSPYGVSKLSSEHYCRVFFEVHGLETVCLRFFNVYGPRQGIGPYSGVVSLFIDRLRKGKPPVVFGDGRQSRDFVYVEDVVDACLLSLSSECCVGEAINVGSGVETSINELAETLIELLGLSGVKPEYAEARDGDIRRSCASIVKAENTLGYRPKTSLRDGLRKLAEAVGRREGRDD